MDRKKDIAPQVALIARVMEETGLSREELADYVLIKNETLRKAALGHQALSERVLTNIRHVPAMISAQVGGKKPKASPGAAPTPARPPSVVVTCQRLAFVLGHVAPTEAAMLSSMVDTAFRQVSDRLLHSMEQAIKQPDPVPSIIRFPVGYKLRAVLGDIAAGLPQEAIQQASEWVAVPPKIAKEVTFVLRAKGDSMIDVGIQDGDLIYLNAEKEPRNGNVVAALCDHDTCLKTYVAKGREQPYLKTENKTFPPKIVPVEELLIQGVMIGKHPKP